MPPGGDHALVEVDRGDAADREAVALVDVGHGDGVLPDAWQRSDVDELLEGTVADDLVEHPLGRVDAAGHAHVVAIRLRDLPKEVVEALQVLFAHQMSSTSMVVHSSPLRRTSAS